MTPKNNMNGTVTISVEDFEQLRDIESKTPCVKIYYEGWGFERVECHNESEALKKFSDTYKNRIKELNDIIISKQKEILDHKETIKKLNVTLQQFINVSKNDLEEDSMSWWKKIFNYRRK